nr:NADH dehydrogenase subunit 2 [Leptocoris augur]
MSIKNKLPYLIILIISTMITVSSESWLGMWMGLEINLMSFIPLISKEKNKNSSQSMMIYFLTQSIGSIIFLFTVLMNSLFFINNAMIEEIMITMIMTSIFIKLGAAPFHFWLPEMMANLKWMECLILMTWQKVAPLVILSNIVIYNKYIYVTVMLSTLIGAIGGLNQTSLRKILAYSSINHLGWMIMLLTMSVNWYNYLIFYSVMIMITCLFFFKNNNLFINQINKSSPSILEKYTYVMIMLSLGGLPPFLGFFPKWMVIQSMISSQLYLLLLFMMLMSLLTLFYYLRMITPLILSYTMSISWNYCTSASKTFLYFTIMTNFMLPIFSVWSFF